MSEPILNKRLDGLTLRGYARGDLDAMFRLDEICFEEPFRFSKADMRRFTEARRAQVLLAEADAGPEQPKELAGFSIVHVERSRGAKLGYLLTLDVAPGFRRQGLAQRLMKQAEDDAQAAGCAAMLLHVFTGNMSSITLYEKLGYVRVRQAESFYGAGLHAWVYRKELAS